MIKHIGRHGEQKLVVVFRQLQGHNEHMALVVKTETLPSTYHDELMMLIQSERGQGTNNLAEVLGDTNFSDGANILNTFHAKGWLKKVPSKQIIMTPTNNANSHVRLDEINEIVNKLELGGEGAKKLAELDAQKGLYDPANDENIVDVTQFEKKDTPVTDTGVLDNKQIAQMSIDQANQMEAQIKTLTEEAARLKTEAYEMAPELKPKRKYAKRGTGKIAQAKKAAESANVEA